MPKNPNGARQAAIIVLMVIGVANAGYAAIGAADDPHMALPLYIAGAIAFLLAAVLQLTGRSK